MYRFPPEIGQIIGEYAAILKLRDWIPREKLHKHSIWANPHVCKAGFGTFESAFEDPENHPFIARNRAAEHLIRKHHQVFMRIPEVWMNASVIELLVYWSVNNIAKPNITMLSANASGYAMQLLDELSTFEERSKISHQLLSMNPAAEDMIRFTRIHLYDTLQANPSLYVVEKRIIPYVFENEMTPYISWNPHPWAIEYTRTHPDLIDWFGFSMNPGIFEDGTSALIKILDSGI